MITSDIDELSALFYGAPGEISVRNALPVDVKRAGRIVTGMATPVVEFNGPNVLTRSDVRKLRIDILPCILVGYDVAVALLLAAVDIDISPALGDSLNAIACVRNDLLIV